MSGTSNFQQFNPPATNQENDAAYTGDPLRAGGIPVDAICPSPVANKLFYQLSIFVAAFGQMMATKNYSPNDGSAAPGSALANLEAVLANIMTQNDMGPFATTAAVTALITAGFAASFNVAGGYIKFPTFLGGFIIQWGQTPNFAVNNSGITAVTVNWPLPFPTAVMAAVISDRGNNDYLAAIGNLTLTTARVWGQATGSSPNGVLSATFIAIGH